MASNFRASGEDIEGRYLYDYEEWIVEDAVNPGGRLWMTGGNNGGQLGDDTTTSRSSPVQTVSAGTNWKTVCAGKGYNGISAGIKTDGTLWLWGSNSYGSIGDNTTTSRSSPVQTVSAGTNWKQVASGAGHVGAVKTDGTLWMWGRNYNGTLGNNDGYTNESSPVQTVSAGSNWKLVACGEYHTAAIKTDGTLWLWGVNAYGRLGDNTRDDKSSPVQTVSAGTNWKQVAGGGQHTAAVKTDGTLWCWGRNTQGQLGDNTSDSKSSPVQTVAGGTNWKQVACGERYGGFTVAVKTDGTLWSWGSNSNGQLGDNTTTDRSSPVQTASAGTNWKLVACGNYHTAAVKTDGTLWAWGQNYSGHFGDGTTTGRSSPVQILSPARTYWSIVSCGKDTTGAISL